MMPVFCVRTGVLKLCCQRGVKSPLRYITLSSNRGLKKSDEQELYGVTEHSVEKTPITAQLWEQRKMMHPIAAVAPADTPTHLIEKTPEESSLRIQYDFSSDPLLRDMYVDFTGNLQLGKIFQDLDALAGNIAHKHCDDNNPSTRPLSLVTVSVDKIRQAQPLTPYQNLVLIGQVVWVGNSSLDILMAMYDASVVSADDSLSKLADRNIKSLLTSYFTFVARDARTNTAATINRLSPSTSFDTTMYQNRQLHLQQRKRARNSSIDHETEYRQLVERGSALVDMPALAPTSAILMRDTALENCFICQPQNVNTAGRVFGGFLMHRAYDLAVATCYTFAGSYPLFLEVDKVEFRRPVDIGDLVRLRSRVVLSNDDPLCPIAMVEVTCQVMRPERASSFVSNTFNFIFQFKDCVTLKRILPSTTEEATVLVASSKWLQANSRHQNSAVASTGI